MAHPHPSTHSTLLPAFSPTLSLSPVLAASESTLAHDAHQVDDRAPPSPLPPPTRADSSTTPPDPLDALVQVDLSLLDTAQGSTEDGHEQAHGKLHSAEAERPRDKGKGRETHSNDDDERRRIVQRVLKRAEVAKITRSFQNRLALAAFKTRRGWQDVTLDVIEPHLEQEAAARLFHDQQTLHRQQQQYQYEQERMLQQQQEEDLHRGGGQQRLETRDGEMGPPPMNSSMLKRGRGISNGGPGGGGGGMNGGATSNSGGMMNAATPSLYDDYQHHPTMPASPLYNSYTSHDPYHEQNFSSGAYPSAIASTSALPTPANHQRTISSSSSFRAIQSSPVLDSHRQKRRQTSSSEQSDSMMGGSRSSPLRRPPSATSPSSSNKPIPPPPSSSTNKRNSGPPSTTGNRRTPLSSSDPNFSSFVDAATALTGLSRAPSASDLAELAEERMVDGSSDNKTPPPPPVEKRAFLTSSTSKIVSNGLSLTNNGSTVVGPDPFLLRRPRTPERSSIFFDNKGKSVAPSSLSKSNGTSNDLNGNGTGGTTTDNAAELMLFLAASPSPAHKRSQSSSSATNPLGLGDSALNPSGHNGMMKGRRLFSAGEDTLAPAPSLSHSPSHPHPHPHLSPTLSIPMMLDSPPPSTTLSLSTSQSSLAHSNPTTHSHSHSHAIQPHSPSLQSLTSGVVHNGTPSTPSRERQVSYGAGGAAWEAYLNVSPSPRGKSAAAGAGAFMG